MKLIDADALKAFITSKLPDYIYGQFLGEAIIEHIDAMPDAGCALQSEVKNLLAELERVTGRTDLERGTDEMGRHIGIVYDAVDELDRLRGAIDTAVANLQDPDYLVNYALADILKARQAIEKGEVPVPPQ